MFRKRELEGVIAAQNRHIDRLENMVQALYNALVQHVSPKEHKTIDLVQEEKAPTIVSPAGVFEPDPGEVFNPNDIKGIV